MKLFVVFGVLLVAALASAQSSEDQGDHPSFLTPKFRYIEPKANCRAGRLYHDGCSWCECMGEGLQDECDDVPCGENTLGSESEESGEVDERSVRRKRNTSMCENASSFHEHNMECFCPDKTWYWCREEGSNGRRKRTVAAQRQSNICQTVSTFHEHGMECFCRDNSWYWCRQPNSNVQYS